MKNHRSLRMSILVGTVLASGIFAGGLPANAKPEGPYRTSQALGFLTRPGAVPYSDDHLKELKVPAGFRVSVFAKDVRGARMMVEDDAGYLYVSSPSEGIIERLRDADGNGSAEERTVYLKGYNHPHGLALHGGKLYFVALKEVFVADLAKPDAPPKKILEGLPDVGQHENRAIGISPDGKLYVMIAANCNSCDDPNPDLASMQVYDLDGKEKKTFAKGLRDTIGFDWQPGTNQLFGMDHGVDWHGDDLPPEELNSISEGKHYGFPYCFVDKKPDPNFIKDPDGETKEQFCSRTEAPVLKFTAHSAPIAFKFYAGAMFPADYKNSAFVAMHGSWNRKVPVGYEVLHILFDGNRPAHWEPFLSGFLAKNKKTEFGRPAGLLVRKDGSLLVSDDQNGVIYRVTYEGKGTATSNPPTYLKAGH